MVGHHIEEGREHLNFSEWAGYTHKKKSSIIHECIEEIEEGEMPMGGYTIVHSEAKLNEQSKNQIVKWLKELENQ